MYRATFRFYDELNFFLPRRYQHATIEHHFGWRASIKDMIESLGVPHAEIELIVVNGVSVSFDYIVRPGDSIGVCARGDSLDVSPRVLLRRPLIGGPAFVLDQHLGRLAAYLRMMGFDTLYRNDYHDDELARISQAEDRVLLTRDVGLLKRSIVTYGCYVRATHPEKQLLEITRRFDLLKFAAPFKHCMKCNGLLQPIAKTEVLHRISGQTAQFYDEFHCCASCGRIYWKGAHFQRMQQLVALVMTNA
jgi:uncharacterized protein with PIN domain